MAKKRITKKELQDLIADYLMKHTNLGTYCRILGDRLGEIIFDATRRN